MLGKLAVCETPKAVVTVTAAPRTALVVNDASCVKFVGPTTKASPKVWAVEETVTNDADSEVYPTVDTQKAMKFPPARPAGAFVSAVVCHDCVPE